MDPSRTALVVTVMCLAALGSGCGDSNPSNPTAPSAETWALTVKVTSEAQVPIRNATVRVMDGANASRTAMSDESGTAVFTALKEGTFGIEVTAQDYYRATASVALTTSRTVSVAMKERNRPPVITSLVTVGTLPNQPSGMAETGEEVQVVASIADTETPADRLEFAWTADAGTLTGTGATVRWRAPSSGTFPASAKIGLVVTERFTPPGASQAEVNRTTGELTVRVHSSKSEVAVLGCTFLQEFSDSKITDAVTVIRNFSTGSRCAASRSDELDDVTQNRLNYEILSSTPFSVSAVTPTVTVAFNAVSPWNKAADAWVTIPCGWTSKGINPAVLTEYQKVMTTSGICRLTAVYDVDRWALCASNYTATTGTAGSRFIR